MTRPIAAAFACCLCMSLGLAPLFLGTFPLFLQPVSAEFGWGASVYPQAPLIAGVSGALVGPIIGQLIDRFGVRTVLLISLLLWAAGLVGISFLNGSRVQMLIVASAAGIAAVGCGPIALAKIVAGWFDRNRGLALAIVLSAVPAVATAVMIVVTSALLGDLGWRNTYRLFAAGVIVVACPAAFLLIREASGTEAADHPSIQAACGLNAKQALATCDFWMVMLLTGLLSATVQSVFAHFVAFSAEFGITSKAAAVALSAFSLAGQLGPLLAGLVADRARGPKPLIMFYGLPFVGVLLMTKMTPVTAVAGMALLGIGFQSATGMLPYLMTRYFGVRYASQIFGVALGIITLSMGLGPVVLGFAKDHVGSFSPAIPAILALLAAATAVSALLRTYEKADTKAAADSALESGVN